MSSWNYRIVRKKTAWTAEDGTVREHISYGIHEAFYDDTGKVSMITENPIDLSCESLSGLQSTWNMPLEAFGQPILDFDKIPEEGYDPETDPIARGLQDIEEGNFVEMEDLEEDLGFGDFDLEAYEKEEAERMKLEEIDHEQNFIGKSRAELLRLIRQRGKAAF